MDQIDPGKIEKKVIDFFPTYGLWINNDLYVMTSWNPGRIAIFDPRSGRVVNFSDVPCGDIPFGLSVCWQRKEIWLAARVIDGGSFTISVGFGENKTSIETGWSCQNPYGRVHVFDLDTLKIKHSFGFFTDNINPNSGFSSYPCFSKSETYFYLPSYGSRELAVFDRQTKEIVRTVPFQNAPQTIRSFNEESLVCDDYISGSLNLIRLEGPIATSVQLDGHIAFFEFIDNGKYIIALTLDSCYDKDDKTSNILYKISAANLEVLQKKTIANGDYYLRACIYDQEIYVLASDGCLHVYSLDLVEQVRYCPEPTAFPNANPIHMSINEAGRGVIFFSNSRSVVYFDLNDDKEKIAFRHYPAVEYVQEIYERKILRRLDDLKNHSAHAAIDGFLEILQLIK